jgi:hypothetical protein
MSIEYSDEGERCSGMSPNGIDRNWRDDPRMPTAGAARCCRTRSPEEKRTLCTAYRSSVNLHTTALRRSLGALGDDEEVERSNLKGRETNEVLMEHWRQEHRNPGAFFQKT